MIESVVFIIVSALIRIQLFDMLMNPMLDGNYILWGIHTEVQLNCLSEACLYYSLKVGYTVKIDF